MALIGVISHCQETAAELETALIGKGHQVRAVGPGVDAAESGAGLFVVDVDCDVDDAVLQVRRLSEDPSTTLVPVLVTGSPESRAAVAQACAYGATGFLRKPFIPLETVPDTEKALFAAQS